MNDNTQRGRHRLLVIPPILIGVLLLVWLVGGRQPPEKVETTEAAYPVRVLDVAPMDLKPVATGYGPAAPAQVWSAVAQVSGRVIDMHPELRDGEVLTADTLLLRIDPADYELAVARAEASLAELDVQSDNANKSLALEQDSLVLAEKELARLQRLASKGSVSRSSVDEAERAVLSARNAVQGLKNTLALLPAQRQSLQAQLDQATLDLARTEIHAPMNMRVAALAVERDQYVGKGQTLFQGDAVERTEILAQFPISTLRNLFVGRAGMNWDVNQLNRRIADFAGFEPTVRLDMGGHIAEWPAAFVRFSDKVDSATRTVGIVVAVDDPLQKVIPGLRPPLSKGMFVQVRLQGRTQQDRLLVPRTAVRDGTVLLSDADDRLQRQAVDVLFYQGSLAVIGDGLTAGDRIVLSDIVPAVPGMLLEPQVDAAATEALRRAAGE